MSDSLLNEDNIKKFTQIEMQYSFDKKEHEQKLAQQEIDLKNQEKLKTQKLLTNAAGVGFLLTLLLIFFVYRSYKIKKKANIDLKEKNYQINIQKEEIEAQRDDILAKNEILQQQKEEIQAQRDEIEKQRNTVVKQKEEITDSIRYAKNIQKAVLPPDSQFDEVFPEHFILYKPRDIVSGDFYWMKTIKNYVVITAADCTGHGVPGAFMSMLGMSFLNEIVSGRTLDNAGQILDRLRNKIKTALHQSGRESEQKDGMDMALMVIDKENKELQFAGAYNPLVIIRNNEMEVIKADRQPVAIYISEKEFTNTIIKLQEGDLLYTFSDGYQDQIGGPSCKKFLTKNLKNLLLEIHNLPLNKQRDILELKIEEYKGNNPQIDDMLVIGIKI